MFHIGILQLTQNLDDAVRGFKEGLIKAAVEAEFIYRNADGNAADLPALAQDLANAGVDLIFACTTPAAMAAKNLTADIPVLFTPVFEPVAAGLLANTESPEGKLSGVCGMITASQKIDFIKKLLPDIKKLGVVYHKNDANSMIETSNFLKAAKKSAFEITEFALDDACDISLLGDKLAESKLEALFLPIGRIMEENFSSIAYYADNINLPIIASHAPNVVMGALGGIFANHADLGRSCAMQAKRILADKAAISDIPVEFPAEPEILLNSFAADNLDIVLPEELKAKASEIYN